jgi:NADH pyrophosphatase NudC (nudix superfamily)
MPDPEFCARCGAALASRARPDWKPTCPRCGYFRATNALPVVLVRARAPSGRILYTRQRGWPDGAWGLVAGFVEEGETAEAAALREVLEETGLRARAPRAGSDAAEARLAHPDPAMAPEGWPARTLVEELLPG